MSDTFAEFFARIEQEHGKELAAMPLPDGLPEHLAELIRKKDQGAIQMMLKVAWQMGAQAGVQAGLRLAEHGGAKVEFVGPEEIDEIDTGTMKA